MPSSTQSERAARARRERLRAAAPLQTGHDTHEPLQDPCPLCGAELQHRRQVTRRQAVLTAERGAVRWRCPDCQGQWQVRLEAPASKAEAAALGYPPREKARGLIARRGAFPEP